jgi:hypothetical protein
MNHDEILKLRAERIKSFRAASGGGTSGVVPAGMAGFLLAVSPSRIKTLVAGGRLETIAQGGQRWILFSSLCQYAQDGERHRRPSKSVASKLSVSKSATSELVTSKLVSCVQAGDN